MFGDAGGPGFGIGGYGGNSKGANEAWHRAWTLPSIRTC